MVIVGLPDTVWFPADALRALPDETLSFLLFPVQHPELFDAVVSDSAGLVQEIQVKHPSPSSNWIWGAFKMPAAIFHERHDLWKMYRDEYVGTLVNRWLDRGGTARGVRAGTTYIDVGAMDGYFDAIRTLAGSDMQAATKGAA
jgi:glucose-1-phosphate thymidylyltransferase